MDLGHPSPLQATDQWPTTLLPQGRSTAVLRSSRFTAAALTLLALTVVVAVAIATGGSPRASSTMRTFTGARAVGPPAATDRLPLSAQAQISGALAAGVPAFGAVASASGFSAENPTQGFRASFDESGVAVTGGSVDLHMRLQSIGFGTVSRSLSGLAPTAHANRVGYAHPQLSEWYRNGPQGLEQGFTIARAAAPASSGPLTLTLALSGNASASLSEKGQSVVLRHGTSALSYGALVATDASGRELHGRLALVSGELLLRIDAAGARYPLTIDPLIQKGVKLSDGGAEARFGASAALSADGSTLLVGAPQANGSLGAAWVFERSGQEWQSQDELTSPTAVQEPKVEECAEESSDEVGECAFGASVALSADGNTALVGAPSPNSMAGAAWIFTRSAPGATWTREAEPLRGAGNSHEGRFGKSVALSADGALALVGDPATLNGRGAAWVFADSGSWTQQAMLSGPEVTPFAHFGRSVALSADGATAIIGSPGDSQGSGAASVFTGSGATWTQLGTKLTGAGEGAEGHFGNSVALSADGATALVGAQYDSEGRGAVWTFAQSGTTFAEAAPELTGPQGTAGHFGTSLALSASGDIALIGSPHADNGLGLVGEFARSEAKWTQEEVLGGTEASGNGYSGASVALSRDGEVAAIGASRDARRLGAAWVFSREPPSAVPPPTVANVFPGHGPTAGGTPVTISGSNFPTAPSSGPPVVMFGSARALSVEVRTAAEIRAVTPPGAKGVVHVTVATSAGKSSESEDDSFRYEGEAQVAGDPPSTKGKTESATDPPSTTQIGSTGVAGVLDVGGAACHVSLRSRRFVVARHKSAAIRLQRTGTGACRGTLALRYRQRTSARHFRLRGIGSVHFAIAPGRSQVVTVKLNRLGRSLFVAGDGKLKASAVVLRTTPGPRLARTASVRLSVKKPPKPATIAR
jgi:hypothetical protein